MPVEIRLPWKCKIAWTKICHTKLFPDTLKEKSLSLVAFASILKKLLTFKVSDGTFCPPHHPHPGRIGLMGPLVYISRIIRVSRRTSHCMLITNPVSHELNVQSPCGQITPPPPPPPSPHRHSLFCSIFDYEEYDIGRCKISTSFSDKTARPKEKYIIDFLDTQTGVSFLNYIVLIKPPFINFKRGFIFYWSKKEIKKNSPILPSLPQKINSFVCSNRIFKLVSASLRHAILFIVDSSWTVLVVVFKRSHQPQQHPAGCPNVFIILGPTTWAFGTTGS